MSERTNERGTEQDEPAEGEWKGYGRGMEGVWKGNGRGTGTSLWSLPLLCNCKHLAWRPKTVGTQTNTLQPGKARRGL